MPVGDEGLSLRTRSMRCRFLRAVNGDSMTDTDFLQPDLGPLRAAADAAELAQAVAGLASIGACRLADSDLLAPLVHGDRPRVRVPGSRRRAAGDVAGELSAIGSFGWVHGKTSLHQHLAQGHWAGCVTRRSQCPSNGRG